MAHGLYDMLDSWEDEDQPARNGAATAALALGVSSILLSVITGIPAIVAALVGLSRVRSRGVGMLKSWVGLVLGLASVAILLAAVHHLLPVYTAVQSVRDLQAQGLPPADSPQAQQGIAEAEQVLEQVGVDPDSVTCRSPAVEGTDVVVDCTGMTSAGDPAVIEASCPAVSLLGGAATCEATVNGDPISVRVTLRDGLPTVELR